MLADGFKNYVKSFWSGIEPDPIMTVSAWADTHRILSQKASAEAGRWDTKRTPYLREIMDCLSSNSVVEEVVFIKGAQVGGTECGNNWIGYIIDHAPGPMMSVNPTVDLAKRNSKQRIQPLIDESPRLRQKVKGARERDSGNTMFEKDFPGGRLVMTGANSAVGLRSMPARYLFLDEEDAYPGDVDGEGDPSALARARTRTFARKKIFRVSTPKMAGRSRIEAGYDSSDKRRYHVPCPTCKALQVLKWSNVKYTTTKTPAGKDEVSDVHYVCDVNGCRIEETSKEWFLSEESGAKWIAEYPGARNGKLAGFHLNSLYSPYGWFSWAEAAQQWVDALGKPEEMRGFINTVLGETWKDKGDAPDWQRLYDRREQYAEGAIASGDVVFLTAGADVQRDRIEVEIVGWCRDKQSYSVDYLYLLGDTATDEPWAKLDEVLYRTWKKPSGSEIGIKMMAVDTGFNTQHCYNWVRKHSISKVMAIKGQDQSALLLGSPTMVDVTAVGKKIRRGLRLWPVGVSVGKSELYSWLKIDAPTEGNPYLPGYCHFPERNDEYFKQLTAEQLVVHLVRGHRRYAWEKTRDRNEALDCRIYARAAACAVGLDRFNDDQWAMLAEADGISVRPEVRSHSANARKETKTTGELDRKKSSWLDRGRG